MFANQLNFCGVSGLPSLAVSKETYSRVVRAREELLQNEMERPGFLPAPVQAPYLSNICFEIKHWPSKKNNAGENGFLNSCVNLEGSPFSHLADTCNW